MIGLIYFITAVIVVFITILATIYLKKRIISIFTHSDSGNCSIFSDIVKLFQKEDSAPKSRKKISFFTAPLLIFCPILCAFCLIPFFDFQIPQIYSMQTGESQNQSLNLTAVLLLALVSIPPTGRFLAGYSNSDKYSILGAVQSAMGVISHEIPIIISLLAVTFMAGSLNINDIILAQNSNLGIFGWYFLPLIIGCVVFFISAIILLDKIPFNLSKSSLESAFGQYSGAKFILLYFGEYGLLLTISLVFVCLFFGGYLSPFGTFILPGRAVVFEQIFWLALKTFFTIGFIILIKITIPKPGHERFLAFSYKILLPLSLINLNIALIIKYFAGIK